MLQTNDPHLNRVAFFIFSLEKSNNILQCFAVLIERRAIKTIPLSFIVSVSLITSPFSLLSTNTKKQKKKAD